jgi:hypothetical protein
MKTGIATDRWESASDDARTFEPLAGTLANPADETSGESMSNQNDHKLYPDVQPQPDFAKIERAILATWEQEGTFRRSVEERPAGQDGSNEFVFYDGPPFANGLPHYGHLITSYIKDIVPRYQTLRGRRVERRFGWDTHGLPVEMLMEKELGVSGRAGITEYGIGRFNQHCRESVFRYTDEWERYVTRAARWVDFDNDYKTLDITYMESVIWAVKQLWEKGLLYEGYRVLPYSWAAQTPLSNFETRLDDAYRDRQDPAVIVRFELVAESGDDRPTDLLAWTTTPWTLPSNLYRRSSPSSRARGGWAPSRVASWWDGASGRCFRSSRAPRTPSGFWRATSSTPKREPVSCTSRRASARTTWWRPRPPASPWCARWTTPAASPPRCRPGRGFRSSTPTSPSCAISSSAACSSSRTPTSTAIPTAGARTRRSSTRP